ncbi:MAG: IclR family transcriptional regulator [Deferribacteres bacterium]|nr:IclR family transcriptional regulator [Deferribacteres bacterium]
MVRKREKSEYLIQSVSNACDILESFSLDEEELGINELAKRLELNKNQVQRLLATLEFRGFVERSRLTGGYKLGLKIFELGQVYTRRLQIFKKAKPILEMVVKECNETAYLGDLRGEYVVYLMSEETSKPVRAVSRVGSRFMPHSTALGKAILAFLPEEEIDKIYPEEELKVFTSNTIKTKSQLKKELKEIRERGYALDMEETEYGVRCIGAPIFNYTTKVIAGISISGPVTRFTEERIENELAPTIVEAAKKLSQILGFDIGAKIKEKVGEELL